MRQVSFTTISVTVEKFFMAALLLSTLGLTSCAKSKSSQNPTAPNTYTYETDNEIETAIDEYSLTCKGSCPESHGALLVRDGLKLSTCTFTVVGRDILLTNRHCLPDSIAKTGASCKGSVTAIFARNEKSNESFECKTVLSVPEEYHQKAGAQTRDFAFLQLARSPLRKPVQINPTGVADGEALTVIAATPEQKDKNAKPSSRLESFQCKAHMNSAIDLTYTTPLNTTVIFKNCPIVHGHSGSGMLDSQGNLKAVAQATASKSIKSASETQTFAGQHDRVAREGKFAMGTNAACFDIAELDLSSAKNRCSFESPLYDVDPTKSGFNDETEQRFAENKLQELNERSEVLQFELTPEGATQERYTLTGERLRYVQKPLCVRGASQSVPWVKKYLRANTSANALPNTTSLELTTLRLLYVVEIDQEGRYSFKKVQDQQTSKFSLPLREIAMGVGGPFQITETRGRERKPFALPFCESP